MTDITTPVVKPRYTNINAVRDLPKYRLPLAGFVSILHRISGFILAAMLPVIAYMLDLSLTSELSYERFISYFAPLWVKLLLLGVAWAFLHHLCAGVRHLLMDLHVGMEKDSAKNSAVAVFAVSLLLTAAIALKTFGVF